jgi:hypothetical protein
MPGTQSPIPTTLWLFLFPLTYVIHFAEEYWGGEGYSAYLLRLRGVHLSPLRFVVFQALGFVLFLSAAVIARQLKFPEFMIVILGGLVLCNGITHTITALWDGHYGPGLFSSMLLWIPLGSLTLVLMFGRISHWRLALASLIGFGINGIVALVALRGGRLR